MEECPGQRDGSTLYYFEGHMYRKNRATDSATYYRCSVRGCFGRVIQKHRLGAIVVMSEHNHDADNESYNLRRFRAAVQRRVDQESTPAFEIYREEARRFPGVENMLPFHTLETQLDKRTRMMKILNDSHDIVEVMMEPHIERFLEQRLEHFDDHGVENHYDLNLDQNNRAGLPRCEVTMNNQGGDKLHFNGYSYSKKAISANAIRWTCATPTRSETRCKGAITTDRERPYHNPRSMVEHNHPPEDSEASIMRDIARAKRRFRRRTFPHPLQFYPWMLPLQQLQEQASNQNDGSSLDPSLGMGGMVGAMDRDEAGPSGMDNVKVKMEEPEWVDAGALEPNCELAGQYDDNTDYNSGYGQGAMSTGDGGDFHHFITGQQSQPQQPPLVQDGQDPVQLHVPGKPNLTITVAPPRKSSSKSSPSLPPPPALHLLNPLLTSRKRGRPRGTAYGSYSESDDRVTTILTDSIIASHKLEKMERAGSTFHPTFAAPMPAAPPGRVKPRSKDPEAIRAADIVNQAQNRSGPRVIEELEKVHLKLRQEVLALEVQNLKAEREKLIAYRRNVAIRREIMVLHLQLDRGIPSECASSGRGLETVDSSDNSMEPDFVSDFCNSIAKEQGLEIKTMPEVSITRQPSSQSPKISVRKSLQTSNHSPNVSPLSSSSSVKCATPPAEITSKSLEEIKQRDGNRQGSDGRQASDFRQLSESKQLRQSPSQNDNNQFVGDKTPETRSFSADQQPDRGGSFSGQGKVPRNEREDVMPRETRQQSVPSVETGRDDFVPIDSVSSDLSVEMLSEPGSSQMTQSSVPLTEHEGFDDIPFEGEDSYDINESIGAFSGGTGMGKGPPVSQYSSYCEDESAQKRRRVENMWEPDDGSL